MAAFIHYFAQRSVNLPSEFKGTNFGLDFGLIADWRNLFDAAASKDRFRQRVWHRHALGFQGGEL